MRRGVIYGREVTMQGSPYTLLVYRQAFSGDLARDLASAYGDDVPDVSVMLQAAWAMCRTWSDDVPDYPEWLRGFDPLDFSLGDAEALGVIDSAIAAELFRRREARGPRAWLARLLERLSQRARACADRLLGR